MFVGGVLKIVIEVPWSRRNISGDLKGSYENCVLYPSCISIGPSTWDTKAPHFKGTFLEELRSILGLRWGDGVGVS